MANVLSTNSVQTTAKVSNHPQVGRFKSSKSVAAASSASGAAILGPDNPNAVPWLDFDPLNSGPATLRWLDRNNLPPGVTMFTPKNRIPRLNRILARRLVDLPLGFP
ncbi:hypothetical protein MSAN_00412700 [Mycena sanguinolenta]|uniref:Uncharacterized protein n=1 Tax=Mycena sanguinolenta TaxID=230812 RepID=A0A8H6ZGM3_9AGAR|nr:hypothetical protein MSAN_00412700 [Mycena sanguinolenta]